jgi:DNA/RNA-binding domain of Phe-tRNA-synthetase-like protein
MSVGWVTAAETVAITAPVVLAMRGLTVQERDPRLDAPIAETTRQLLNGRAPDETIGAVRAMYRRFGVDPTKTRPSSEALLRRLRKGDALPRINSLVDVGNWCSVETQFPYGLYDLARIQGPVELRLGRPGEQYPGIRKDLVHVAGRLIVADREGPFGNPTSDSARTMVGLETTSALIVVFAPAESSLALREHALRLTEERIRVYLGGEVTWTHAGAGRTAPS